VLDAICLFVAGALRATLPATEFTVGWNHSVEKTRWEERYRIEGTALRLVEARIRGSGAGMEPAPDATLMHGWWTWRPRDTTLATLRLTLSPYTRDYDICWHARCESLQRIVNASDVVDLRACSRGDHPRATRRNR